MSGFFKSLRSMFTYRERARLESERQRREGYSVRFIDGWKCDRLEYCEGDKLLACVGVSGRECDWRKGTLYASTFKTWDGPVKGRKLTPEEVELVARRISEYMIRACGAEEVILDDSPAVPMDEVMGSLGWEAQEVDGQVRYVRKSPED